MTDEEALLRLKQVNSVPNNNMKGLSNGSKIATDSNKNANGVQSSSASAVSTEDEKLQLVWRNIFIFIYLHIAALYGGYLWVSGQVMLKTFLWGELLLAWKISIVEQGGGGRT